MAKQKKQRVQVRTPVGTAAYAWIHKPDDKYPPPKFKITLVLDGDADVSDIEEKAIALFRSEFPDVDIPDDEIRLPIKDGSDHRNDDFDDKILIEAKSGAKYPPQVFDTKRQPLKRGLEVWSGDLVRLVVSLSAYESVDKVREGRKVVSVKTYGVTAYLNIVQLVEKRSMGAGAGADLLDDIDGFTNDDYDLPLDDDVGTDVEDDDGDF